MHNEYTALCRNFTEKSFKYKQIIVKLQGKDARQQDFTIPPLKKLQPYYS